MEGEGGVRGAGLGQVRGGRPAAASNESMLWEKQRRSRPCTRGEGGVEVDGGVSWWGARGGGGGLKRFDILGEAAAEQALYRGGGVRMG